MPIDIAIRPKFPVIKGGRNPTAEFEHLIVGATSIAEAHAAYYSLVVGMSPYYTGTHLLPLQEYELSPFIIGAEDYSGDVWSASASFGLADQSSGGGEPQEPGDPAVIAWDTTGGEVNVKQAISQVDYPAHPRIKNFYKNAIGVTKDGVDGVDIVVPNYSWTEQYTFAASFADFAYARDVVMPLTGRTNDDWFRGFAAGEVLFHGASASRRGYEKVEVTYKFSGSPNAVDILVSPGIPGDPNTRLIVDVKAGHEYLWCSYVEKEVPAQDGFPARVVLEPRSAHVATVYEEGDFSTLRIGVL